MYSLPFSYLQSTAELFAKRSLSVTLWGVVSFKAQGVGLQQLAPLAELTGGAVSVCVGDGGVRVFACVCVYVFLALVCVHATVCVLVRVYV